MNQTFNAIQMGGQRSQKQCQLGYVIALLSIFSILTVIAWIFYTFISKPKKLLKQYIAAFQKAGFKVKTYPFKPFGIVLQDLLQRDIKRGDALLHIKNQYRDNDIVITNMFNKIVLELTCPELVKQYYRNQKELIYPKYPMIARVIERAIGKGLVFAQGQNWKKKRRIITAAFTWDLVKSLDRKIQGISKNAILQIQRQEGNKMQKNGQTIYEFDIMHLTIQAFANVVIQCFFGGEGLNQKVDGIDMSIFVTHMVDDILQQSKEPLIMLLGKKFCQLGLSKRDRDINRRIQIFNTWGYNFVEKKVNQAAKYISKDSVPTNVVQALAHNRLLQNQANAQPYTNQELLEDFKALFVAGTDTTAHFLVMMIYYIAQNPLVQAKVRREIDQFMKQENYSYQNLKNLEYITNIQKETTRLYGPISQVILRQATQDNYFQGVKINKGTLVSPKFLAMHYSQKYFEKSETFNPDRWISAQEKLPSFVYTGFSGGARTCIGKQLALLQSKILLIVFLKRYKKIELLGPIQMLYESVYTPAHMKTRLYANEQYQKILKKKTL